MINLVYKFCLYIYIYIYIYTSLRNRPLKQDVVKDCGRVWPILRKFYSFEFIDVKGKTLLFYLSALQRCWVKL